MFQGGSPTPRCVVTEVEVVLERRADEVGDPVLRLLRQLRLALLGSRLRRILRANWTRAEHRDEHDAEPQHRFP